MKDYITISINRNTLKTLGLILLFITLFLIAYFIVDALTDKYIFKKQYNQGWADKQQDIITKINQYGSVNLYSETGYIMTIYKEQCPDDCNCKLDLNADSFEITK